MPELGKATYTLRTDSTQFNRGMAQAERTAAQTTNQVGRRMRGVGTGMQQAGRAVTLGFTLPMVWAMKKGIEFDQAMSAVKAKANATDAEFQKLRETAIQLGAATSFSAKEAAKGMELLAASGFKSNQIIAAMPGLLDAAAASGEELGSVADIMAVTLTGFGLKANQAGHVSDVLAKAANETSASIGDMGEAMKYVAPIAKVAGFNINQMAGYMTIMAKSGIKGSQAGTTLRMAMARMAAPPKKAAKQFKDLGIALEDAHGKMKSGPRILAELSNKFGTLSREQKLAAAKTIFGAEAMTGMVALLDAGPAKMDKWTKAMKNSTGEAHKMATTMRDNDASALEQMMGALESVAIAIHDVLQPYIIAVAHAVIFLSQKFLKLPKGIQTIVGAVLAFIAIGGPLAVLLGGIIILVSAIGGPVLLAVAAIGAIVIAFTSLMVKSKSFREFFIGTFNQIVAALKANFAPAMASIMASARGIMTKFVAAMKVLWPLFQAAVKTVIDFWANNILPVIVPVLRDLLRTVNVVLGYIGKLWQMFGSDIVNVIKKLWGVVSTIWKTEIQVLAEILRAVMAVIRGDWGEAWEHLKKAVVKFVKGLGAIAKALGPLLWAAFKLIGKVLLVIIVGLFKLIGKALKGIWNGIKAVAAAGWDWIVGKAKAFGGKIMGAISGLVSKIVGVWKKLSSMTINDWAHLFGYIIGYVIGSIARLVIAVATGIAKFAKALWNGAKTGVTRFISFMQKLPGRISAFLQNVVRTAVQKGSAFINALRSGASRALTAFVNGIKALPGRAAALAQAAVNRVGQFMSQLPGKVRKGVTDAINKIKELIAEAKAAAKEIGDAIVQGIINGIKAGAGAIKDAAKSAAKGALDGAKDALHIGSPSRLMAKEVGEPITQGIAVGMMRPNLGLERATNFVTAQVQNGVGPMNNPSLMAQSNRPQRLVVDDFEILNWEEGIASFEATITDHIERNNEFNDYRGRAR